MTRFPLRALPLALTSVFALGLLSAPSVVARRLQPGAALLQEKGGEEETGPYSVVENWPAPWAKTGYIWGSQPGVFAESPNRIFIGPHKIRISPYDPDRHVWVVNDARHVIYEFTNDKQLVRTLGETDVAGNDEKHFGRPQDIAWLPDGSLLVADGLATRASRSSTRTGHS